MMRASRSVRQTPEMFWGAAGLLCLSLLLGGGTSAGFLSDVGIQLAAIPALALALLEALRARRDGRVVFDPILIALFGTAALILLTQLLPLPIMLTSHGSAHELAQKGRALVFAPDTWSTSSATPTQTWQVAVAALPPLAAFLCVALSGPEERRRLAFIIIMAAGASIAISVLQVMQGPDSPLRFFEITNDREAVGFFANRNHLASFLLVALMFAVAWLAWSSERLMAMVSVNAKSRRGDSVWLPLLLAALAVLAILLGLMLSRSRAGLGLAGLAMIGVLVPAMSSYGFRRPQSNKNVHSTGLKGIVVPALGVMLIIVMLMGAERVASRLGSDPTQDLRWVFGTTTMEQIWANLPFGTGLGSFVPAYAMAEPTNEMRFIYANRAHNDLLEFVLETGIAGVLFVLLLVAWYVRRSFGLWFGTGWAQAQSFELYLARAASIATLAVLLHSLVDYPLRTTAMAVTFASLMGFLVVPRSPDAWLDLEPEGSVRRRSSPRSHARGTNNAPLHGASPGSPPTEARPRSVRRMPSRHPKAWRNS
jgi:O-antigen ligase